MKVAHSGETLPWSREGKVNEGGRDTRIAPVEHLLGQDAAKTRTALSPVSAARFKPQQTRFESKGTTTTQAG